MNINKIREKNVWVLVGTTFHTQFSVARVLNSMWKVDNFLFRSTTSSFKLEGTSSDHLVQPPLLKQGQLQRAAQDHVQLGYEYLHRHSMSLGNVLVTSMHQFLVSLIKFGY